MDCTPPGSSIHGILQSRILEWVTISLPDPWINLCLLHWWGDSLPQNHLGSLRAHPKYGWCHALLQGIFSTPRSNPDLPHCRQITVWATREAQFTLLTMLFHISLSLYLKFLFPLEMHKHHHHHHYPLSRPSLSWNFRNLVTKSKSVPLFIPSTNLVLCSRHNRLH